jgi:hypothetical protein
MTPIFFDTFFNLEKYLDHEQRDPFASQRDHDIDGQEVFSFSILDLPLLPLHYCSRCLIGTDMQQKNTNYWSRKKGEMINKTVCEYL